MLRSAAELASATSAFSTARSAASTVSRAAAYSERANKSADRATFARFETLDDAREGPPASRSARSAAWVSVDASTSFSCAFAAALVALVGARHAIGAAVSDASSRAFAGARSLAPLEHGYVRYGLASKLEAGENHVLRERNRALGERVSALELELRAATDALEVTHSLSPCAACSRDRELRAEAEERARTAEARSAALGTEVHALRALSTRFGASARDVQKASRSSSAVSRAWLDDPGVSFSAQVAAAATAAATVTLEARVSESTAARHAAEAEAEATRVEIEVLRNLIDEGFLPGGAGGKCWAEVADAKARAQVAAARVAGERAQSAAAFAVREKLDAYPVSYTHLTLPTIHSV